MSSFAQSLIPLTGPGSGVKRNKILPVGSVAPQFTLFVTPNQTLSLRELLGRPVILAFYPADWSPICGDQMALYNEVLPEFASYRAALVGISVDSVWCHAAFAAARNLHFPLASDFEPKGQIARLYRAYRDADGTSERALFVIDRNGIIAWSYLSPVAVNPGADGILEALDKLTGKTMG
ncbi:MAG: redoxin domain-containing protein [Verrucomicrobia bacterium]|nr:redoxin domain-containing protein [Verrucomicrobiota bacterium]